MSVTVRIDNSYEDGHESSHVITVADYDEHQFNGLDAWWEELVWPETGDGHARGNDMYAEYTATIVAADDTHLIGMTHEWSG